MLRSAMTSREKFDLGKKWKSRRLLGKSKRDSVFSMALILLIKYW